MEESNDAGGGEGGGGAHASGGECDKSALDTAEENKEPGGGLSITGSGSESAPPASVLNLECGPVLLGAALPVDSKSGNIAQCALCWVSSVLTNTQLITYIDNPVRKGLVAMLEVALGQLSD